MRSQEGATGMVSILSGTESRSTLRGGLGDAQP